MAQTCRRLLAGGMAMLLCTPLLFGQNEDIDEADASNQAVERPAQSDSTSLRILQNYITASGGPEAHRKLTNISAKGVIIEAGRIRDFELIETSDGKRRLTYKWRHLGRNYVETTATNGEIIWQQATRPEAKLASPLSGIEAEHFAHQFWLLQPILQPDAEDAVFQFQGSPKVAGRPTHLVVGYWPDNVRTWIYFDQETFLPIRWGGLGQVASTEEYVDYRSIRFEAVQSVFLPKAIDLLIEDNAFGEIRFTSIQANLAIEDSLFEMPVYESPVLRQKQATQANTESN